MQPAEKEAVLEVLNEWEEAEMIKGRAEGRRGREELILRLLRRRVGSVPSDFETAIRQLPDPKLDAFAEALLDWTDVAQVRDYISGH